MAFNILVRTADDMLVLSLSGRLTIGPASTTLHERIEKFLNEGARNIVLDMRQLEYVDSSGLGAIVTSLTCAKNRNASLRLANVPSRIRDLLAVSSLSLVFQIVELPEPTSVNSNKG